MATGDFDNLRSSSLPSSTWYGSGAAHERFRTVLLPVAALLVPLSIQAIVGWLSWRDVWADAQGEMVRAAASAAEYGQRTMESYALAVGRINDRLRGMTDAEIVANEPTLHRDLQSLATELTQSETAYVIDRNGQPLLSSTLLPTPRPSSLADRDYFQALRSSDAPDTFVSQTFLGRFDGRLLFSVAKRRRVTGNATAPDGFDGVVLISVSPTVLADGLRKLLPAATDRMALVGADRYGRSTTSGLVEVGQPLPQVPPESPFSSLAAAGVRNAVYMSTTATPGERALLAMQLIDGFPIYAVAIRPATAITRRWTSLMVPQLAFALPATVALFLLSLKVARHQRLLSSANAALRLDNELSSDRLDRAKAFGLVGTFEADPRTGHSIRSAEYMSVQGLPAVAARETHDDWLARLHRDDRERAAGFLRDALADPNVKEYAQSYRIVTPSGEIRWIAARGAITRDASGHPVMLLGAHVDVTPLRATEAALAETGATLRLAQEAVGIGTWEISQRSRTIKLSSKTAKLCGLGEIDGTQRLSRVRQVIHPEDRRSVSTSVKTAFRQGASSSEFRVVRSSKDGLAETAWLACRATVVGSSPEGGTSLMGVVYEVSEQKRAEEMTMLMAREVEHRAKNALAVVLALLRMTRADTVEELTESLEGRVNALSQTMGLLGQGRWRGAELRDILMSELHPFSRSEATGPDVVSLDGPSVFIDVEAAQPLAMTLHELATNAAKYGALSRSTGRLEVHWQLNSDLVTMTWRETGGPPVIAVPARAGFGSRLIKMMFETKLRGTITRDWDQAGLTCTITFPISGVPHTDRQ